MVRFYARSLGRVLKDTTAVWILFLLIVFLCYTISSLIVQSIGQDNPVVRGPTGPDFAEANDVLDIHRAMLRRTWPPLKGYEHTAATETTHPNDTLLLYRIEMSQRTIKTPLFRIKKDGVAQDRHPWKFEKIIHQTWKTEEIPGQTAPWVKKWLEINPDWTYIFWTDNLATEFIRLHYPSLLNVYESWTIPVQKADMFRLLVLYTFGGVYADLDVEPLRPLDDIRDWSSCVLSREPDLQTYVMVNNLNFWANNYTFTCNAFMACRSHHPFLHYLIGRISLSSPLMTKKACHLDATILCTGPIFLSLGYGYYLRSVTEDIRLLRRETNVYCPEYEYFMPTFDPDRLELLTKNCKLKNLNEKQKEACSIWQQRGYKNEPMAYSYANHHWFHSYHYNVSKTHVDINSVTKTLMWKPNAEENDFEVTFAGL